MCDKCELNYFEIDSKTIEETEENWNKKYHSNRRAGVILMNYETKKILIIQSYHKHWGLPKGHLEHNETQQDCAIRETFEETGIHIDKSQLGREIALYGGSCVYYIVDGTHFSYDIKHILNKQEITGIGWTCLECLKKWNESQDFFINNHLRNLLFFIEKEFNRHEP